MGYIEETDELKLDFKKIASMQGQEVIPVAIQNADTGEVILVAYTNEQAFLESIRLKRLVLWSTSRNELWHKGKTSGNEFELVEVYVNCEQNSLVYKVKPLNGNICHTSYNGVANNCFYRKLDMKTMKLINTNLKIRR
jgi:phosphoribosyl-AMP cyclohydrolase